MVYACGLEFLKNFMRIFVMFVNEEVYEIVLIISSGTDYQFSTAFHFQGFDVKYFLL